MRFARQGLVAALAALTVLAAVVRADFVYKDFNDTTGLIVSSPPRPPSSQLTGVLSSMGRRERPAATTIRSWLTATDRSVERLLLRQLARYATSDQHH